MLPVSPSGVLVERAEILDDGGGIMLAQALDRPLEFAPRIINLGVALSTFDRRGTPARIQPVVEMAHEDAVPHADAHGPIIPQMVPDIGINPADSLERLVKAVNSHKAPPIDRKVPAQHLWLVLKPYQPVEDIFIVYSVEGHPVPEHKQLFMCAFSNALDVERLTLFKGEVNVTAA